MRLLIFFVLYSSLSYSQADSSIVIKLSANKTNYDLAMGLSSATESQLDSITYLSINFSYSNKDSCIALGEKSIELGRQGLAETPAYANALLELGDTYRIYGDFENSLEYLNEGLNRYEVLEDTRQIAYAHNKLGAYHSGLGDNEQAIEEYLQSLKAYEELKDTQNIFKPNLNIGWIFYRLNQIEKAQEYNDIAYELATAINDKRQAGMALNNRGIYLKEILDRFKLEMDSMPDRKEALEDSINLYRKQIYQTHANSLSIAEEFNDQMAIMRSLVNMAIIKDEEGLYSESISLARRAENISKNIGNLNLILSNKNFLCKALRNDGKISASIRIGEESRQIAKENNMKSFIAGANNELLKSYKTAGLYEKALKSLEEINEYIRQTNEESTTKTIAEAESKYQLVQKENEILLQNNEILELADRNAKMKTQKNVILGGSAFVLLAGFFTTRLSKLRKERNDKKEFAEALIYAQEEERKRIARDLHDGIGQSLLMIKKQMEKTHDSTVENQKLIGQTLEEVRHISRELHPIQLEKFGLTRALEDILNRVSESTDIFVSKDINIKSDKLDSKIELNIYRVVQESLNNIIKHSGANACKLEVIEHSGYIHCRVLDNGHGFDYELSLAKSKSLGLQTMNERIANIGGTFSIEKNQPGGTVINFKVPVKV